MATKTLVDTDSTQTLTNKTLTGPVVTAGIVALAAAPTATLDAATKGYVDGLNINPLNNGSLSATVASNILTLSLRTAGGSTPSAGDPVRITFRSATDNDGSLVTRTVSATTSMTLASGSSLGMTNAIPSRVWVGLLDNVGTVELCVWNPVSGSSLKAFTPNMDVTTTAEGSGTATSPLTLYSTNARSSVPFVLLGFLEVTEATAGVWATAPSVVQTYRDGVRKTGDVLQTLRTVDSAVATGTTAIPYDDTIPQNTEGTQFLSQAITPFSAANLLEIHLQANIQSSAPSSPDLGLALFQDATANALSAIVYNGGYSAAAAQEENTYVLTHRMLAGTSASTTLKMRAGSSNGATITFNGAGSARKLGGVMGSFMQVTEICT